jgi:hypothetical protein
MVKAEGKRHLGRSGLIEEDVITTVLYYIDL